MTRPNSKFAWEELVRVVAKFDLSFSMEIIPPPSFISVGSQFSQKSVKSENFAHPYEMYTNQIYTKACCPMFNNVVE